MNSRQSALRALSEVLTVARARPHTRSCSVAEQLAQWYLRAARTPDDDAFQQSVIDLSRAVRQRIEAGTWSTD